jgi:DNA-binding transcriptional ArsR family regulator
VPVRDLTGRDPGYSVQVEAGLAYEFLISLAGFGIPAEQHTYEVGPEWFEKIRTSASDRLLSTAEELGSQSGHAWINLVGLATEDPPTRDVPAFLERAAALAPIDLRLYLLGYHVPAYQQSVGRDLIVRAAEGDRAAQARWLADRSHHGKVEEDLGPLLSLDPDRTKALALELLERWYHEVFRPLEPEFWPVLERDAEAKRALVAAVRPEQAIEIASGIEFVPQPGIRRVYLIPQITTRPWVWLAEHEESRLYCYPVADESMANHPEDAEPPGRLVRMHKALGDEKRMRMLRALATSSATLQELADRFGLPKSTAHHHLAILRSAGLVRVTSDEEHRYTIRKDAVPEIHALLQGYLGPAGAKEARDVSDEP